jgi:hypothetical protein
MAMMMLPDGRNVDLNTGAGAQAFLSAIPEFATRNASQLRDPTLRSEAKILILQIWGCLAANAPGAVLANVASSEKQQIVQVALETFTREKKNGRWCVTGTLDRQSQQTLDVARLHRAAPV